MKIRKPSWCDRFEVKGIGFDAKQYEENGFRQIRQEVEEYVYQKIENQLSRSITLMVNTMTYIFNLVSVFAIKFY